MSIQYYVWHKTRKILRGPFMVDPRDKDEIFRAETGGEPGWVGGTLEKILREPDVDRIDVAQALGVRK